MKVPNIFVVVAATKEAQSNLAVSIRAPIAQQHVLSFFDEVQHPELLKIYETAPGFYAWRIAAGPRNRSTWESMANGDYMLFVYDNAYQYIARVLGKYDNATFAKQIWGQHESGKARQLICFLTQPSKIDRPVTELRDHLRSGYIGFTRITKKKLEKIVSDYGSVDLFVNRELTREREPIPLYSQDESRPQDTPTSGEATMSREIDLRDTRVSNATPERVNELQARAAGLSGLAGGPRVTIVKVDEITGNPSVVKIETPGALDQAGNYVQRALELVQNIKDVLGLAPTQPAEFEPDPLEQQASSGAVAVHLQQKYKGIHIFQAAQTVRFAPSGALTETTGNNVTVPQDVSASPELRVEDAVLRAAEHVAVPAADEPGATDPFGQPLEPPSVDLTGFEPKVIKTFANQPAKPTVLEKGPFGDEISASLVWFPLDNTLRLAWEVILTMPNHAGQYRTLVDAQDGRILYCRNLVQSVAARGNIFALDGTTGRQMTNFPKRYEEYGLPVPIDLRGNAPADWVEQNTTVGNSVIAHLGDDSTQVLIGIVQDGVLTFNPPDPSSDAQKVLNIFYHNCFMHDFFYLLGFRERDGNFQRANLGQPAAPGAGDPVDARAHSGQVWGTANFITPVDGQSPTMNMGLVTLPNGETRHTAFDSSVVYHEYTHGVTNRLVGGPTNTRALEAPQSRGMGEGWGDYIACLLTNRPVVAAWVMGREGGIRTFRYDDTFPAQTDNFGSLGKGRYTAEHAIGEIWCATLMDMTRRLGAKLDIPLGIQLSLQLVIDALKLSPANPSFLDMRDAILTALDNFLAGGHLTSSIHSAARRSIWEAFAKFGMGPGARSNGAFLTGIIADFNLPPDLPRDMRSTQSGQVVRGEATPNLTIPDNNQTGITSTIAITQSGTAQGIKVSVAITHTYISDLQVGLLAPSGRWVTLHDRAGANQANLNMTYDSASTPALAPLVGQPIQGNWILGVRDVVVKDIGTLNRWSLEFNLAGAAAGLADENVHYYGFSQSSSGQS